MPARQPPAQAGGDSDGQTSLIKTVVQSVGIFFLVQFAMKQFLPQPQSVSSLPSGPGGSSVISGPIPAFTNRPTHVSQNTPYNPIPQHIAPIWPVDGTLLDLSVYVTPSVVLPSLKSLPMESLVLEEKAFRYGDWNDTREISATFPVPKEAQNNGTLWAHFLVALSGNSLDPSSPGYDTSKAYHFARPLTQYLAKKKVIRKHNLLSGANETTLTREEEAEMKAGPVLVPYYHPNFTLSFIPDTGTVSYPNLHPAIRSFVQLERTGARDSSGQNGWYYPILYLNTFWQLRSHMTEVNTTIKELPINIELNNMGNWKFSILASIDDGMKLNAQKAARGETLPGGGDGSEFEMFKEILLDSNIYLLSLTGIVSVLHMVFEMLAFKNDVSHWRKKKDNVGTSVRTILANIIMQTIIFLYLIDNNENTSWMILFGQVMGIAIEAWKITKTVNVRIRPTPRGSSWPLPYTIAFEDKHKLSDTEKKTAEYDAIAFRYMYMLAIPLLAAYAVYSVIYEEHKSWYSFVITTLVGSVYAYGFLMMVPSLYINYRLKSVAHMPSKAMMYKFLNTFIDDLFAFTIKMPTLHRLATLRDDVIFFVYLYQKWVYKVDYSRVNEFGQGGESDDEKEETKAGKEATKEDVKALEDKAKSSGVQAKYKAVRRK
ncbi:uncharacterized protein PV09_09212 [Verruconis gallopava]|uniref:Cleft lip and palate transmembrane protein 1 n=1 Tax=Verruconis gallopava TaxID=253628 RepID=A0A0D1ZX81_9PEZI|nr:uncharacterized protein PV09_09212 [Verruconis gallopava]KIV99037.1 hypothetical protein PV09_09212 [Verruconis gallopava]